MEAKKVHFMGIGGAGVSAVAAIARESGYQISGCDLDEDSQFLKSLLKSGLEFNSSHNIKHLEGVDTLVISPAIESLDPDNSELKKAKDSGIEVLIGEKFLAKYLLPGKKLIAVSGTHGKSTTTAMVAKILEDAGFDPSVLVGAVVSDWGKNFRVGKGEHFVLEADEYQEKFLLYFPFISVVTAIEMDHPEYFTDIVSIKEAFQKFIDKTDPNGSVVLGKNVNLEAKTKVKKFGQDFEMQNLKLKVFGEFNQENANIAYQVAKLAGVEEDKIKNSLGKFSGIGRRLEFKGEVDGIKIFDDYGHHPTAIEAIISAAREKFPSEKLWLVYQPHMYSRTNYLFDSFVETFKKIDVDEIVLVDIFAAREENKNNISSAHLVDEIKKSNAHYIGDFEKTAYYLAKNLSANDVVIVMGAGDIYRLSDILLAKLKNRS